MADTVERIGRIRPTLVEDGRGWWSLRAVCDALRRSDYQAASALIPPEHKRRWKDSPRDWKRKKIWCLIDRKGVEKLVIRYCHDAPRWAVMAALDAEVMESPRAAGVMRGMAMSGEGEVQHDFEMHGRGRDRRYDATAKPC